MGSHTGYYDDRGYRTLSGVIVGTAVNSKLCLSNVGAVPNPLSTLNTGFDTRTTQRGYGDNSINANQNAACQGSLGDAKGLDIWTYISSNVGANFLNIVTNRALATILKTKTAFDNNNTPTNLSDDTLTYGLALRVESSNVTNAAINPVALIGINITVDFQSSSPHILVSDAIPTGTVLKGTTAPTGWKVVYTTTPTTTTADQATWTITQPASGITRVGFINDTASLSAINPGTTVSGFSIQLLTSNIASNATTATINNIAQVVGGNNGDPNTKIFDNSGDQNPSNYDSTNKVFPTVLDSGVSPVSPTAAQIDTGNNNTGTNSITGNVNQTILTTATTTNAKLLLVKRITRINNQDLTQLVDGDSTVATTADNYVASPGDIEDNDLNWPTNYLRGSNSPWNFDARR